MLKSFAFLCRAVHLIKVLTVYFYRMQKQLVLFPIVEVKSESFALDLSTFSYLLFFSFPGWDYLSMIMCRTKYSKDCSFSDFSESWRWSFAQSAGWSSAHWDRNSGIYCWKVRNADEWRISFAVWVLWQKTLLLVFIKRDFVRYIWQICFCLPPLSLSGMSDAHDIKLRTYSMALLHNLHRIRHRDIAVYKNEG